MANILDKGKSVESYLFQSDKERIVNLVIEMGGKVRNAIDSAVDALFYKDMNLARQIITSDDEVDDMEREIDQECLRSIAMRQPVRDELRFIFAVLKIITDLERIGDQAVNIASWGINLKKYSNFEANPIIGKMRDITSEMLKQALEAFQNSDSKLAVEICQRDDMLDDMYSSVFDDFIRQMVSDGITEANLVRIAAGQVWVARHLERVGDHITNIAERAYFMLKGVAMTKKNYGHLEGDREILK